MNAIFRWCVGTAAFIAASSGWSGAYASPPETIQISAFETHRVAEASTEKPAEFASDPWGRWYAGLHIGAVHIPEMNFFGGAAGLDMDTVLDVGPVFSFELGYKLGIGLRFEAELAYRINDTESVSIPGFVLEGGSGAVESMAGFLNAWYDFDFPFAYIPGLRSIVPHLGGGLGYAKFDVDPGYVGGTPPDDISVVEGNDMLYVWQVGGGIAYKYSEDIHISLDYRFMRPFGKLHIRDRRYGGRIDARYKTHSLMLGLRGFF